MSQSQRYVVLPAFGFSGPVLSQSAALSKVGPTVSLAKSPRARTPRADTSLRVLHSTHENGPKLVEMTPRAELNLRLDTPGLKIVPVVEYRKLYVQYRILDKVSIKGAASGGVALSVVSKADGTPITEARVVAFTNFDRREGAEGVSNRRGEVVLKLKSGQAIERLYVYAPAGFWGFFATGFAAKNGGTIKLAPVDLSSAETLLPSFIKRIPLDAGAGVRVAIVDSGIAAKHPALPGVQGANLVFDEIQNNPGATTEWGPASNEGEHGTHVAGIVGAKPVGSSSVRGVAPGVELRSYRVFPNSGGGATNYDIMNAIDRAVLDGCHIINLSLGGGAEDEAVRAAIGNALDKGVLVVAAAGNDGRRAVSFPAALPSCVSVSAMGRRGTFPKESTESSDIAKPFGDPDKDAFIAAFSNVGPQIDVTGPGVGVVSTLPENAYGVMSGTSMACPAVTGFAAYVLGANKDIMAAKKSERVKRLKEALYRNCRTFGFGRDFEGFGMPTPASQVMEKKRNAKNRATRRG